MTVYVVATWDLCLILGGIIWLFNIFLMCLGRERKAQLSLPSNTYATSILVIMQAGDGSVAPGLNGTACLLSIWLSACFPKRGWPHSHCPLGAVPGPCCPLNPAQPLCGKLLAGRSRSCAREQADNGAARAGGVHPRCRQNPVYVPVP